MPIFMLYALILAIFRSRRVSVSALEAETSEVLMQRFQRGDERAFEVLMRRLEGPLLRYVLRLVPREDVAQDILQDTFLRVIRNAQTYQPTAKVSTWIYTIARNLCLDRYRRQRVRREESLDAELFGEEGLSLHNILHDPEAPDPSEQVAGERFMEKLAAALERLNPDQRDVFVLREVQGYKFTEIAELVGESENTVKSRMRYALQTLQRLLASEKGGV
jgi:RNA polymerase sigma-70 factor (ECF subfamily)